jgi:putative SOS response-associated peptidase YedK
MASLHFIAVGPGPYGPGNDAGHLELNGPRWGLIPHWWKKETLPSLTFNARSEEAAEKPTWRHSLRSQRCLMPAGGW